MKDELPLILPRPDKPGIWIHWRDRGMLVETVLVECGPSSGLYCRELRQGGSIHCGFREWRGDWRYMQEAP